MREKAAGAPHVGRSSQNKTGSRQSGRPRETHSQIGDIETAPEEWSGFALGRQQNTSPVPDHQPRIDRFFAGPGARGDQWRNIVELAEAWPNEPSNGTKVDAALAEMAATED
jgi:hypothetical protein